MDSMSYRNLHHNNLNLHIGIPLYPTIPHPNQGPFLQTRYLLAYRSRPLVLPAAQYPSISITTLVYRARQAKWEWPKPVWLLDLGEYGHHLFHDPDLEPSRSDSQDMEVELESEMLGGEEVVVNVGKQPRIWWRTWLPHQRTCTRPWPSRACQRESEDSSVDVMGATWAGMNGHNCFEVRRSNAMFTKESLIVEIARQTNPRRRVIKRGLEQNGWFRFSLD